MAISQELLKQVKQEINYPVDLRDVSKLRREEAILEALLEESPNPYKDAPSSNTK